MKKSRKIKRAVHSIANGGAYFLIVALLINVVLVYFSEDFDPRWAKVVQIVGTPFSLGLGFFIYGEGVKALNEYKKEDDEKGK
ncbi:MULTISPECIES: hypothetical protein [Streptococcus]|jgi:hypothetical protein|uniref:Uncharacterized protein n=1 Tax=Streptococcus toyakuensis TaxID=2819619 RepID=A0ABM7UUT1_9STRE|nr:MULTISPECIES: hypothetical protein [Streptococcus]MBS5348931.1 hypothetical protein [Streptococcus mitis]MQQ66336.1 hypothetical protein [Streptococcus mitis]OAN16842.1 hypothetical protein A3Q39_09065 [Streptococcus sp. CCUG 49591]BDB08532.1 hypothetical protein STYK_03460 [Streptococcus toyakuensis]